VRAVLIGLAWYAGVWAVAWFWVEASRPATCPKGHTDLYRLDRWRCRVCEREGTRKRPRRDPTRW